MERGGAEGYALAIARGAVAAGSEVSVAFPPCDVTRSLVHDFKEAGAHYLPLSIGRAAMILGRRPRMLVPWIECFHTLRAIARIRPDAMLAVLPGPAACFGVLVAAALLQVPAAACLQLTPLQSWSPSPLRRRLLRWAAARGQRWIAVSTQNLKYIKQAFYLPDGLLHLIYNGAPQNTNKPQHTREALMEQWQIPAAATLVLTAARLAPQKAHEVFLDAAPAILHEHPHVHFVWLGDGELRETLAAKIEQLGLGQHFTLTGFSPQVSDWLRACDLYALPTHYEGLPFSLVEAMAAGCPVVASAVSSIPEVLNEGQAGRMVENTPGAWAAAVNGLLAHPAERSAVAAAAKARAAAFSEATMVADTLALISQLAAEGKC